VGAALVAAVVAAGCGSSGNNNGFAGDDGGASDDGSMTADGPAFRPDTGADVGSDAASDGTTDDGGADGAPQDSAPPMEAGGPTFGTACDGGATKLTGTVYAPNGIDPLPKAFVYVAAQVNPFPARNFCQRCNAPIDPSYARVRTGADGTFTLDLTNVPLASSIKFAVNVGRFRKVTTLPVTPCTSAAVPQAASTLPGRAADGDIPKIAVSVGNKDHLDQILGALKITEFTCLEGRKTTTTTPTCQTTGVLSDLLTNQRGLTLDDYHMVFISCAPGAYANYAANGVNMQTLTSNLNAWTTSGGRVIATDTAYDYVGQTFPAAITWQGPGGSPQPVDGANVGQAGSGSYAGNIDDQTLAAWLRIVGFPQSPSVTFGGFVTPWSVISSLPTTSKLIANGTVTYGTTTGDVPLTTEFDVGSCGRVIYSSYHTLSTVNQQNLTAQEKVLEYLIFESASCTD